MLAPFPPPDQAQDRWDEHHVRMPHSEHSLFPVEAGGGGRGGHGGRRVLRKRWQLAEAALGHPILDTTDLARAVLSYNRGHRWSFSGLRSYVEDELEDEERAALFERTVPTIVRLAVAARTAVTRPVPLLRRGRTRSLTFSQTQVASLLANAFLCTFPRRNPGSRNGGGRPHEYAGYPDINFNRLFGDLGQPYQSEKLKCLFGYFTSISGRDFGKEQEGLVTYERRSLAGRPLPDWGRSAAALSSVALHADAAGMIETEGYGMLQVDFANAFVGGGVLGHGCVQVG